MQLRKKTRRVWSDADKEALIRKAGSHQGPMQEFLDTMRVSGSWFRNMRKNFLKTHPEIDVTVVPVVKMASGWPADPEERRQEMRRRMAKRESGSSSGAPKSAPGSFASLPDSEKTVLIKEYYALPVDAKLLWREQHKMTVAMAGYWKNRLMNKASRRVPPGPALAILDPAVASVLAAYRALPLHEKAPWREAHHLSNSQLFQVSRGTATPSITARILSPNGNRQLAVRDQRLARIPDPISMIPNSAPQPASIPFTFDEVIEAFEVKQDHMREFIDQLKRMRSGSSRV